VLKAILLFSTLYPKLADSSSSLLVQDFTKKSILNLIRDNPSADEYYDHYHDMMKNPRSGIEVDHKINKPLLKLLKLGYRQW